MSVAMTILDQLGGHKFVVMTGAKELVDCGMGLRFKIGRNASKANMVTINLNGLDLYDIGFYKYQPDRLRGGK